jgi:hypothetical protein
MGNINSLSVDGTIVTVPTQVADTLFSDFTSISEFCNCKYFIPLKDNKESHRLNFTNGSQKPYNYAFSVEDLILTLEKAPGTATGSDTIGNQMLTRLSPSGMKFLLSLLNHI